MIATVGALAGLCAGAAPAATAQATPGTMGADAASFAGALGSPTETSFWLTDPGGNIWTFGSAPFLGSPGAVVLNKPVVDMVPTVDDLGYWLVASDGGVFAYGDAPFFGSTGAMHLNKPVVSMAPTPDGGGYWLVASDGGIFAYGDARFFGSTGAMHLNKPVVSMAPTPDGGGYWLVASDGGIFAYGDARFFGSTGGADVVDPAQRLVPSNDGAGYWIVDENSTAYGFGDAAGAPPMQAVMFDPVTPGEKAVTFALFQLGKPYIWGGNGPVGYDCSGLALASWQHAAGVSFARVSNDQYRTAGTPVAMSDLAAGDLVFWATDTSVPSSVDHTGIYVGGGQIVEATGDHVQLNTLDQWGTSGLMGNGRRP
ncbi:MAG: C40 family peptidase [Acidimicrobiales bacterium]